MKKTILFVLALALMHSYSFSQATYYHTISINRQASHINAAIINGSSIVLTGQTDSGLCILKINTNGQLQWIKKLNSATGNSQANDVIINYDGNIVAGSSIPQPPFYNKTFGIIAFNQNGDTLWTSCIPQAYNLNATGITQLSDSSYIVTGIGNNGNNGIILARLAKNGAFISAISILGHTSANRTKAIATADGGFVVLSNESPAVLSDSASVGVLKYDSVFNLQWAKQYLLNNGSAINSLSAISGGGFIATGEYNDTTGGNNIQKGILLQLDTAGNLIWAKLFADNASGSGSLQSAIQTPDNGFLACGTITDTSYGVADILAVKTDWAGKLLWSKHYGIHSNDEGVSAVNYLTGYILFGNGNDSAGLNPNIELISIDSAGESGCHSANVTLMQDTVSLTSIAEPYTDTTLTGSGYLAVQISSPSAMLDTICPVIRPTYYKMLEAINIWHYTGSILAVETQQPHPSTRADECHYPYQYESNSFRQFTGSDTIINGYTYKQLFETGNYVSPCLYGFIREDTIAERVYFKDHVGSPEIVLYDFSLQLGDTLSVNFLFSFQSYFANGVYRLDSIKQVKIRAGVRRVFYLNCQNSNEGNTLIWIESVGNLDDVIYPYSENSYGGFFQFCDWNNSSNLTKHNFYELVICFEHQQKVYYDSCTLANAVNDPCMNFIDTCDYGNDCGGIKEIASLSSFTLSPNPANSNISIRLDVAQSTNSDILVEDMEGKQTIRQFHLGRLPEGVQERELDISTLSPGFYLVECKTPDGALYRKLIIQR